MYCRVAELSPHGQGSISILEDLLPRWRGKALVLCLLGFAATGFIITITLSAADAAEHIIENPLAPEWLNHRVALTLALLAVLGGVFLKGFREAVWLAVPIVTVYLLLNAVLVAWGVRYVLTYPELVTDWHATALVDYGNTRSIVFAAVLLFPNLALGLSGFETGVAVMPLVRGSRADSPYHPEGRIQNTKKLLVTAATIMSVLLIASSVVTTVLIPRDEFAEGGQAYGRALAYLAHERLGNAFGTAYDVSTVSILWFAGASAMVGLLNLVPRYLPRYGMAPEWARTNRPLVLIFTGITFLVTVLFSADVTSQGGAYATGVLMLMGSAALAVTLAARRDRRPWLAYLVLTIVFAYTTIVNIVDRPEGLKIAAIFIAGIVVTSLTSRVMRSTELRVHGIVADAAAQMFIREAAAAPVRIIANRPDLGDAAEYDHKLQEARDSHHLPLEERVLFVEVRPGDVSEFSGTLKVTGVEVGDHRVLRCVSAAVPNAIAALLLYCRDQTGKIPHAYFGWTEGNPVVYLLKFLALGEGDTAPVTREVLRQAEPKPTRRPRIHVG